MVLPSYFLQKKMMRLTEETQGATAKASRLLQTQGATAKASRLLQEAFV